MERDNTFSPLHISSAATPDAVKNRRTTPGRELTREERKQTRMRGTGAKTFKPIESKGRPTQTFSIRLPPTPKDAISSSATHPPRSSSSARLGPSSSKVPPPVPEVSEENEDEEGEGGEDEATQASLLLQGVLGLAAEQRTPGVGGTSRRESSELSDVPELRTRRGTSEASIDPPSSRKIDASGSRSLLGNRRTLDDVEEEEEELSPRKSAQASVSQVEKPNGQPAKKKRGRPPKNRDPAPTAPSPPAPQPQTESEAQPERPKKRGPGRPRKHPRPEDLPSPAPAASTSAPSPAVAEEELPPPPKKRGPGRPKKSVAADEEAGTADQPPKKKRRGRPPRKKPVEEEAVPLPPEPEPELEMEQEAQPEPEQEAQPEPEQEAQPEPEQEAQPEPEQEAQPEPEQEEPRQPTPPQEPEVEDEDGLELSGELAEEAAAPLFRPDSSPVLLRGDSGMEGEGEGEGEGNETMGDEVEVAVDAERSMEEVESPAAGEEEDAEQSGLYPAAAEEVDEDEEEERVPAKKKRKAPVVSDEEEVGGEEEKRPTGQVVYRDARPRRRQPSPPAIKPRQTRKDEAKRRAAVATSSDEEEEEHEALDTRPRKIAKSATNPRVVVPSAAGQKRKRVDGEKGKVAAEGQIQFRVERLADVSTVQVPRRKKRKRIEAESEGEEQAEEQGEEEAKEVDELGGAEEFARLRRKARRQLTAPDVAWTALRECIGSLLVDTSILKGAARKQAGETNHYIREIIAAVRTRLLELSDLGATHSALSTQVTALKKRNKELRGEILDVRRRRRGTAVEMEKAEEGWRTGKTEREGMRELNRWVNKVEAAREEWRAAYANEDEEEVQPDDEVYDPATLESLLLSLGAQCAAASSSSGGQ